MTRLYHVSEDPHIRVFHSRPHPFWPDFPPRGPSTTLIFPITFFPATAPVLRFGPERRPVEKTGNGMKRKQRHPACWSSNRVGSRESERVG